MAPSDRRESDLDAAVQPGRRPVHDRAQIRWRDRECLLARGAAPAARHAGLLSSQGGRRLTDPDDGQELAYHGIRVNAVAPGPVSSGAQSTAHGPAVGGFATSAEWKAS